jgi:hypothetical protein
MQVKMLTNGSDDDVVFIQKNSKNPKKGSSIEPLFTFH